MDIDNLLAVPARRRALREVLESDITSGWHSPAIYHRHVVCLLSLLFPLRCLHVRRIGGFTYTDALHIYGMCRAGYIPQLFSLRLPNPDVVFELLGRSGARALVYDASFAHSVRDAPVPTHLAVDASGEDLAGLALPTHPRVMADDVALYYHTSGSTSGRPKLVPYDYRWLESAVHKSEQVSRPRDPARQDVSVWM